MFRPIRVDHPNCLQVAIKTHSFLFKNDSTNKMMDVINMERFKIITQRVVNLRSSNVVGTIQYENQSTSQVEILGQDREGC
jgi:hypothetical protein